MTRLRTFGVAALLALCSFGTLRGTMPAVSTGTWSAAGRLNQARGDAAAAQLPWGDVLVTGGAGVTGPTATSEVFTGNGLFVPTAPMNVARASHAAVTLLDGRVLVVGGRSGDGATATVETYAAGEWTPVTSMADARIGHTATLLEDGRVLVAGGENSAGVLSSVEIFDPETSAFTFAGTMASPRKRHAAARLADGRILIAGGESGDAVLASIDVLDPSTGTIAHLATMESPRADFSATTLMDGRVLFAGGSDGSQELATTEVFDPTTGAVTPGVSLLAPRRRHQAFLLPDNNAVLIAGGTSGTDALASAELYLPWAGQVRTTGDMTAARAGATGSTLSVEGRLFVAGGTGGDGSDVYAYATVRTDKDDYAPGETVYVSGTGWQPDETVTFGLRELPAEHEARTFSITADHTGAIDSAELFLVEEHHLGVRFYLTARGAGSQAQMTFTDDTKMKNGAVTVLGAQTTNPVVRGNSTTYGTTAAGSVSVDFAGNVKSGDIGCQVSLSAVGLPSGATATFSPSTLTGTATGTLYSLLTISTTGSTTAGTYTFTVRAAGTGGTGNECTSANVETSANVTLVVAAPAANASISGTVYNDANGNGSLDAGEAGLAGVVVSRSGSATTATTDVSGAYSFTGLEAGSYTIDYTVPSGFANTGIKPITASVTAGASSTGNNFLAAPQYGVTFGASGIPTGSGSDTGTNTILSVTVGATTTTYVGGDLPVTRTVTSGTVMSYAYAENVATSDAGTRYHRTGVTGTASPVTVSANTSITGEYERQFKLTLATSPADVGSANPSAAPGSADDFYKEGVTVGVAAAVNVDIDAGASRWHFTSWSGGATGSTTPVSVTMDSAKTITANYVEQFKLTLATSPEAGIGGSANPSVTPPSPDGFFDIGTNVPVSATLNVDIVAGASRWHFISWTNATGSDNSGSVTMDAAKTVTANYVRQFAVTFAQSGIGADTGASTVLTLQSVAKTALQLPASEWVNEGATVTYAYESLVAATAGKRYALTTPSPSPLSGFSVSAAVTVTGTYKVQYEVTFAQNGIAGDTGTYPVARVNGVDVNVSGLPWAAWYDAGSSIAYSFYTPISTMPTSDRQYELTNAASLPSSPVSVTGPAAITGQYSVNVYGVQYLRPIDQSTSAGTIVNVGKNGRVIPVKVQIVKNGVPVVETGTVLMRVAGASCGDAATQDLLTDYADAGLSNDGTNLFRWSPDYPGFWIYNLDTRALNLATNGCYRLDVYLTATSGSTAIRLSNSTWAIFRPVK